MRSGVLLDTGPLVAYLSPNDRHHDWAVASFDEFTGPVISCAAVLTEACFLVARNRSPAQRVLEFVIRTGVRINLDLGEELAAIAALMQRYAEVPMSLADACLVRLAELTGLPICTLDSDFAIYRTHRRRPLQLIAPQSGLLHEP